MADQLPRYPNPPSLPDVSALIAYGVVGGGGRVDFHNYQLLFADFRFLLNFQLINYLPDVSPNLERLSSLP